MGKKKGAGNKLARMSDEERARYLQHRAEIEEEARRRKQQLIAIFMKVIKRTHYFKPLFDYTLNSSPEQTETRRGIFAIKLGQNQSGMANDFAHDQMPGAEERNQRGGTIFRRCPEQEKRIGAAAADGLG